MPSINETASELSAGRQLPEVRQSYIRGQEPVTANEDVPLLAGCRCAEGGIGVAEVEDRPSVGMAGIKSVCDALGISWKKPGYAEARLVFPVNGVTKIELTLYPTEQQLAKLMDNYALYVANGHDPEFQA